MTQYLYVKIDDIEVFVKNIETEESISYIREEGTKEEIAAIIKEYLENT